MDEPFRWSLLWCGGGSQTSPITLSALPLAQSSVRTWVLHNVEARLQETSSDIFVL
jgi:hypothetical protein